MLSDFLESAEIWSDLLLIIHLTRLQLSFQLLNRFLDLMHEVLIISQWRRAQVSFFEKTFQSFSSPIFHSGMNPPGTMQPSAVSILSSFPIFLTARPTTLNILFPSVPLPSTSSSFHYCPIHSFILSLHQQSHSSLPLFCLTLPPSLPGLIRRPHTPSSHLMSGNWRWDRFGGGEEEGEDEASSTVCSHAN